MSEVPGHLGGGGGRGPAALVGDLGVPPAKRGGGWRGQISAPFSRLVGPPLTQWMRWWASAQAASAVQPGMVQPLSRSRIAASRPPVNSRLARPMSVAMRKSPLVARRKSPLVAK